MRVIPTASGIDIVMVVVLKPRHSRAGMLNASKKASMLVNNGLPRPVIASSMHCGEHEVTWRTSIEHYSLMLYVRIRSRNLILPVTALAQAVNGCMR